MNLMLLQKTAAPLGPGLPSLAMSLFNQPVRGIMLVINRKPVNAYNDEDCCEVLVARQHKADEEI